MVPRVKAFLWSLPTMHLGVLKDVYNHGGCKEGHQFLEFVHGGVPGTPAPSKAYLTVSFVSW